MTVLLATSRDLPEGEPGGHHLLSVLDARGIEARWTQWDDKGVDWASADLVVARSTWDYTENLGQFLSWSSAVADQTRLLNGPDVFAWNADKSYLTELAIPAVPTRLLEDFDADLSAALTQWGRVVVKSRTGAGGVGVVVVDRVDDPELGRLDAGPWLVQPLVESIRQRGESSVFVIDGQAVAQVDKRPAGGEIRVHEEYGGHSIPVPVDPAAERVAREAMAEMAQRFGRSLDYGRVDILEYEGRLVASELELIEPGLYLDVRPESAEPFADLIAARLAQTI